LCRDLGAGTCRSRSRHDQRDAAQSGVDRRAPGRAGRSAAKLPARPQQAGRFVPPLSAPDRERVRRTLGRCQNHALRASACLLATWLLSSGRRRLATSAVLVSLPWVRG
jgi:hypothetical protein